MTADSSADPPRPSESRGALGARAARGFLWVGASFGANRILVFASTLVLARVLTPADFGLVAAALTLVLYLEVVLDLGLGAAVIYEQESGISRRVQTAFTATAGAAVVLTGIGVAVAPWIAEFFRVPDETTLFRVVFFSVLLRGLGQVPDALLRRELRFKARSVSEVSRAVVRLVVSVVLALNGAEAWAIVGGLLAGDLVGTALLWATSRFRPSFAFDRAALRVLVGFGGSVVVLKIMDAVAADIDYLVIGRMLGLEALGQYTIAYRLPELLLLNVLWIFSTVAFPFYAAVRGRQPTDFIDAVLRALRLVTLYSIPVAIGLALLARDTVLVAFGDAWAPAIAPMVLLALTGIPSSLGYASGDVFPAIGRPGLLLALNVPMTVVLVTALILAAPYGITAVAAVHLTVMIMYGGARLALANHVVGTSMRMALVAMRPGIVAGLGVLVIAGPVRLLTESGPVALAAVAVAVAVGAASGVLVGARDVLPELVRLARSGRPQPSGDAG